MRQVARLAIPEADKAAIRESLANAGCPYEDLESFLVALYPIFARLSREVLHELFAFRNDCSSPGALHITNVPIDEGIPPTPTNARRSPGKKTYISEGSLLGIARVLGEPFGYRIEKDGEVVQNIAPVKSESAVTSSESSTINLGFHTDLDFDLEHPDRRQDVTNADYILLLCLRQDPDRLACTMYVDARDIAGMLTPKEQDLLRQPLYQFGAAYTFTGKSGDERMWSPPSPILKGPKSFPEITLELACGVRAMTDEARAALDAVEGAFGNPSVAQGVYLKPGEMLLINNRKGAHARSAFVARYDGGDRWLQRLYVRRSLWELRRDSSPSARVF
jgi:L-asparagine oxygenase